MLLDFFDKNMKYKDIINPKNRRILIRTALIVFLSAILIIFTVLIARNIIIARRIGLFSRHKPVSELLLRQKGMNAISASDADYIDSWMTFRYINFIFNLPENYLKDKFGIEDKQYPNLTLNRYAKRNNKDKTLFIEEARQAVGDYIKGKTEVLP